MLYAGTLVFVALALFTARAIFVAWQTRSAEARADAMLSLVAERTPPRPTAAPGAMAWLRLELDRYAERPNDPQRTSSYRSFAAPAARVPDALAPAADALVAAKPSDDDTRVTLTTVPRLSAASLRDESLAHIDNHTLVVTRRRASDIGSNTESNRVVRAAASWLVDRQRAISTALATPALLPVPDQSPPRPVRVYVVLDDGALISAPWPFDGPDDQAVNQELALLSTRPGLPNFAPDDFFFHFDPSAQAPPPAYSGFYLDLGGRGLVATITAPIVIGATHAIAAIDLAFEINWQHLAAMIEAPVVGAALDVPAASGASWVSLDTALPAGAPADLRRAVDALADVERQSGSREDPSPLRHGIVPTGGAVAAFQVSDRTWLLMFFPPSTPAFPLVPVVSLAFVLALLLAGFEVNRRRADSERRKAELALAEKQNLLNTMQVPLVVVDPNSDAIVSANRAAEAIGVRAGARFGDVVWPDERSRAHYQRMQVASPEPRRAYGLPVAVPNDRGEIVQRYAVIRSVAVTAPIEALDADERHRLGVLFVLDEGDDLALFSETVDAIARRDERRRLAGLLTHGVDTLARVLEHCLTTTARGEARAEFASWLAEYLERRLMVTAWLLDHWDTVPPLAQDIVVDGDQVRATIARLDAVLAIVREDRELRSRLHWDNGTLSAAARVRQTIAVAIDWPTTLAFTSPVRGGVGMFIGEVVANAVRHGRPGSVPRVDIACDPIRREIQFRVENDTREAHAPTVGDAYGGLSILRALARLFEWRDLTFTSTGATFVVEWRVPASVRDLAGRAD